MYVKLYLENQINLQVLDGGLSWSLHVSIVAFFFFYFYNNRLGNEREVLHRACNRPCNTLYENLQRCSANSSSDKL